MEAGKTASLLGLRDLAAREFKEILKDSPENVKALCGYGVVLADAGELDNARVQYEKALEINPFHVETLCKHGCLLYRLGLPDEAEEAYKGLFYLIRKSRSSLRV
jgi:Flp pilus assembly protein TadD